MIELQIKTDPIPQQRPRLSKNGVYNPQKKEKSVISLIIQQQIRSQSILKPLDGPLKVEMMFGMKKPRKHGDGLYYHYSRPDIDNFIKFYLDCMNGIVYKDDAQVSFLLCKKIYSDKSYVDIKISSLIDSEGE